MSSPKIRLSTTCYVGSSSYCVMNQNGQCMRNVSLPEFSNTKCLTSRNANHDPVNRCLQKPRTITDYNSSHHVLFAILQTLKFSSMEFPGHERVLFYATPPNNYIGTGIFLSYIIIALYATITIISSLYIKYNQIFYSSDAAKIPASVQIARDARLRHVKIYAFLASISFATLSYHMLSFLIAHYVAWDGGKQFSLSVESLKSWMLQSSLFQDFAQDLVKDAPSAIWTQCAILATWFWNIWMAQKGKSPVIAIPSIQLPLHYKSKTSSF